VSVTESDSGKKLKLRLGDFLVVRLSSNASTGYSWKVPKANGVLRLVGGPNTIPSGSQMPGSAGTMVCSYVAMKTGKAPLVLTYARSWEKVAPAKTVRFNVEVLKAPRK